MAPRVSLEDAHTLTLPAETGRAAAAGPLAAFAALAQQPGADLPLARRVEVALAPAPTLTLTF